MKENFPAIAQVDAYWEGLRNGRLMPDRSEVDPRGMKSALEYAMLLEQVVPGVARVRVSGVHLSDLFGMEIRGMPISAFFDAPSREQLTSVVRRLHNRPEVSELKLKSPAGLGRPPMTAKLYLAPLRADDGDCPRILGCFQAIGQIGKAPRRFAIEDVHFRRIIASADSAPLPRKKTTKSAFAEEAGTFKAAPKAAKSERPYLRMIKND